MFETKCSSQKTVPKQCLCWNVSNVKRYKMNKQPACFQHPPRDADAQQAGTDAPDNSHLVSADCPTSEYVWSAWQNWGPKPRSSSLAAELLPRAGDKISRSRACGTAQRASLQHSQDPVSAINPQVSHWFVGRVWTADVRWKEISKVQKHSGLVGFTCLSIFHVWIMQNLCSDGAGKLWANWSRAGLAKEAV